MEIFEIAKMLRTFLRNRNVLVATSYVDSFDNKRLHRKYPYRDENSIVVSHTIEFF